MSVTVKEVLLTAAQTLGIADEINNHLSGDADAATGRRDLELLLACFQRVESELALDYLPLMAEDEIVTGTGVVEYAQLQREAARIFSVEDEWGEPIKYRLFPTHLKTKSGRLKVIYGYKPREKTIDEVSEYQTDVSKRLLVYGVSAEYCLAVGELSAANIWSEKYKQAVRAAYRAHPCKRIRSRRWL